MRITRRRFIAISAAAGGLPLLPIAPARAAPLLRVWTGTALGCDATLQFHHPDPATADRLIEASLAEVRRLEHIMSLYRPDSGLSRLNRDGVLEDPPFDLVRVLSEARDYSAVSGGAFDVTVQPLWDLYAGHFSSPTLPPMAHQRTPSRKPSRAWATKRWRSIRSGLGSLDREWASR